MKTAATVSSPSPTAPSAEELSSVAVAAVLAAGDILWRDFDKVACPEVCHPRDIKLAVDRECEEVISTHIHKRFPDHRILGEENGESGGDGDYLWIVDPLDGTVNYFYGLPQFCSCVACAYLPPGHPFPQTGDALLDCVQVGVVYAPVSDELFAGISGKGAFRNGKPVNSASVASLGEVIVALSFGKTESGIDRMSRLCGILARRAKKLRSFGSAGYDIANVAAGRFGGLLYRGIHIWDIAAAGIVLKEAGGALTASVLSDGTWDMVASAAGVHDELLEIVSDPILTRM